MADSKLLIERWQRGEMYAAEALYNDYHASTYRLAYGLLGNADDAQEATQDALGYALMNIARYNPQRARFSTWLHTITVSRCRDRQRRKRLPQISLGEWLGWGHSIAATTAGPEEQAVKKETRNDVWEAVQALKPKFREAIVLRYWAGHTYQEMAEIMACPLSTAQSRVRLAYKQLKTTLIAAGCTLPTESALANDKL